MTPKMVGFQRKFTNMHDFSKFNISSLMQFSQKSKKYQNIFFMSKKNFRGKNINHISFYEENTKSKFHTMLKYQQ